MPRFARQHSKSGVLHIILRGINKQQIFEDEEDKLYFIECLSKCKNTEVCTPLEVSERCMTIYAYALMSNHVHLLVREFASEPIGIVMKRIGIRYAAYFNRKYSRVGHLFQDRFKSEVVDDAGYFYTVFRYIHQNPVKAKIVNDVAEYKWTSWHEYILAASHKPAFSPSIKITAADFLMHNRMDFDEINALVHQPVTDNVMDTEDFHRITDAEAKQIMFECSGCSNISEFQMLSPTEQRIHAKEMANQGVHFRHIARLTGLTYKTVRWVATGNK